MNDFLNQYSGFISIVAILISIPLGVLTNLLTPEIKKFFGQRSRKSILNQIEYLEKQIAQTDRLVSDPSFAVAKFINTALRAIAANLFIFVVLLAVLIIGLWTTTIYPIPEPPNVQGNNFSGFLFVFIGTSIVAIFSRKTIELYAMTYRVEEYSNWKRETLDEINILKKKLSQIKE